jgi:hypothetical protein
MENEEDYNSEGQGDKTKHETSEISKKDSHDWMGMIFVLDSRKALNGWWESVCFFVYAHQSNKHDSLRTPNM